MNFGSDSYSHTAFGSVQVGVAAADFAIPHPAPLDGLGVGVTGAVKADELELRAPAANLGNLFVDLEGIATTADLVIRPGQAIDISGASKKTLSAIAANANDILEIIAKYR
jgi:hypothetical protein